MLLLKIGDYTMAKMTEEQKNKIKEASQGLKKLTPEQKKVIKNLYERNDTRLSEIEKLVHKSILFQITGDIKYAPKSTRNERAEALNKILFS